MNGDANDIASGYITDYRTMRSKVPLLFHGPTLFLFVVIVILSLFGVTLDFFSVVIFVFWNKRF